MDTSNTITLIVTVITLGMMGLGILLGFIRGFSRTLIRLILIALSAVIAFFVCKGLGDTLATVQVEGQTFSQMLQEAISGSGAELPASVVKLISATIISVANVIAFVVVYVGLSAITWLVLFPILKLIFCKRKEKKKFVGRIIGMVLGLVGGFIASFAICAPITVLTEQVMALTEITINEEKLIPEEDVADIKGYLASPFGTMYAKIGDPIFYKLLIAKTEDGKEIHVEDTVGAIVAATEMVNEVQKVAELDFSEGLTAENVATIKDSFTKMEQIKNDLTETSVEIINDLVKDLSSVVGEELPIEIPEDFNFSEVNFEGVGNAIEVLYDYSESSEPSLDEEQVETIVDAVVSNKLLIDAMGENPELVTITDEATQSLIEDKVNALTELTEQEKNDILKIFGLGLATNP